MADPTPFDEMLDNQIIELHKLTSGGSFSDRIYALVYARGKERR